MIGTITITVEVNSLYLDHQLADGEFHSAMAEVAGIAESAIENAMSGVDLEGSVNVDLEES